MLVFSTTFSVGFSTSTTITFSVGTLSVRFIQTLLEKQLLLQLWQELLAFAAPASAAAREFSSPCEKRKKGEGENDDDEEGEGSGPGKLPENSYCRIKICYTW